MREDNAQFRSDVILVIVIFLLCTLGLCASVVLTFRNIQKIKIEKIKQLEDELEEAETDNV